MVSFAAPAEPRGSHSVLAYVIDRIVAICGIVPYALVALILRLVVARDFFLSGQAKALGPTIPLSFHGFNYSLILPTQVRDDVLSAFATQFAAVSVSSTFVAYGFTYAEFLLPIFLVIGFATRIAGLLLLIMTVVLQIYVAPEALWTTHVYWGAILLTLMTCGAGEISVDRLIRYLYLK